LAAKNKRHSERCLDHEASSPSQILPPKASPSYGGDRDIFESPSQRHKIHFLH